MARIEYKNDQTRATEETEGSDGRLNVSSRSDERAYYNSRDEGQCYAGTFEHAVALDGEYSFTLVNTSTDKTLVVSSVGLNNTTASRFKLWFVSGTIANGVAALPTNLNKDSSNDAQCTFTPDASGTPITIGTVGTQIDDVNVAANGHEELRLTDRVRLGQNDGIALEMDTTTTNTLSNGVVFFYFE
jgi:hypothetical protein